MIITVQKNGCLYSDAQKMRRSISSTIWGMMRRNDGRDDEAGFPDF
jgi:hypothetical protein